MDSQQIVQALGDMTVMQLIELTRDLEARWGVSATPPVALPMPGSPVPLVWAENEQYEFTVEVTAIKDKLPAIKAVREVMGLGLVESKHFIENLPRVLKADISKADADELKAKLEAVGATVVVR